MRTLEFREGVRDGWTQLPADPSTVEGAAIVLRWFCPSLSEEEARAAAAEASRRYIEIAVGPVRALLREMFER
jgi:hypothetical protein